MSTLTIDILLEAMDTLKERDNFIPKEIAVSPLMMEKLKAECKELVTVDEPGHSYLSIGGTIVRELPGIPNDRVIDVDELRRQAGIHGR